MVPNSVVSSIAEVVLIDGVVVVVLVSASVVEDKDWMVSDGVVDENFGFSLTCEIIHTVGESVATCWRRRYAKRFY